MRARRTTNAALIAAAAMPLLACSGPIEKACVQSGRAAATSELCGCVQRAADATLGRSDQRLAAGFFKDPHRAQTVRQSDRRGHEEFWQRYKAFGATAEANCR